MVSTILAAAGLLAGITTALAWVVIDWGAWALVAPGRVRPRPSSLLGDVPSPEPAPAPERIEVVAGDGAVLLGDWWPGVGTAGHQARTILLLHGFAEDRAAMQGRARLLAEAGWNVAALDSRTRGESTGRRCTFGPKEVADVRMWLGWLARRPGAPSVFAIWGRSMGAAVALGAAEAEQEVCAVVLEAPYATLPDSVAAALRRRRIPAGLVRPMLVRASRLALARLGEPAPLAMASGFDRPVLILAGSDDTIAPLSEVERLAAAFPRRPTVLAVPGAHHNDVYDRGGPELARSIVAFLNTAAPADHRT